MKRQSLLLTALLSATAAFGAADYQLYNVVPMWLDHEAEQASNILALARRTDAHLALYSLSFHAEGRPATLKADRLLSSYRAFSQALAGTEVHAGVLVQSILGHWPRNDKVIEPWMRTIDQDGKTVRFCPLDPGFAAYVDYVFTQLARLHPAFILTDDDVRAYSHGCECFCARHVARFNAQRGTSYSADALRAAVAHGKPGDADYDAFFKMQREMIEDDVLGRIRRAIDAVDPSIPAGVCIAGEEHFFAGTLARRITARGQRPVMRCATGCYGERLSSAAFPQSVLRQLAFAEAYRGQGIDLLDEADTCPHNLWSKSARSFFTHLVSSAFAGYAGAKTWYVGGVKPTGPVSPRYADVLAHHRGYLSALAKDVSGSVPCGLMAPCFTKPKNWHMTRNHNEFFTEQTVCNDLTTAFGVPTGTSSDFGARAIAFALSSRAEVERLGSDELERLFRGNVFVFREAALALAKRGRTDLIGVNVQSGAGKFSFEREAGSGARIPASSSLSGAVTLAPVTNSVETLSRFVFAVPGSGEENVASASTFFVNPLGGRVVTTAYSPSFFGLERYNAARKYWFIRCLDRLLGENRPIAVGNDQDVLVLERATPGARYLLAVNLNSEPIDQLTLRLGAEHHVARLDDAGTWRDVQTAPSGAMTATDVALGFYEAAVLKITR